MWRISISCTQKWDGKLAHYFFGSNYCTQLPQLKQPNNITYSNHFNFLHFPDIFSYIRVSPAYPLHSVNRTVYDFNTSQRTATKKRTNNSNQLHIVFYRADRGDRLRRSRKSTENGTIINHIAQYILSTTPVHIHNIKQQRPPWSLSRAGRFEIGSEINKEKRKQYLYDIWLWWWWLDDDAPIFCLRIGQQQHILEHYARAIISGDWSLGSRLNWEVKQQ